MKKFILLILFIFLIHPVFADDYQNTDNSQNNTPNTSQQKNSEEASEQMFDETKNQLIYDYYGSIESPAFLNREDIDPEDPNTGFSD